MPVFSTPYLASSRRYRPQKFSDIVGQETIVRILKNAILNHSTSHAYIFSGCHGTGKTTLARLLAKALNCQSSKEGEPCNQCSSCQEIATFSSMDVLEIDGASHRGVEDIRQINDTLAFAPIQTTFKIYIIDEVHMLTKEAFNALLKTLEDPPAHVKFFLATTESHKIPETILSRCQQLRLQRISEEKIAGKLSFLAQEAGMAHEPEAFMLLAKLAQGSMRDAESLFDQVLAFGADNISHQTIRAALGLPEEILFFDLDEAVFSQNVSTAFEIAHTIFSSGINPSFFLEELSSHFRTLLLTRHGLKASLPSSMEYYKTTSQKYSEEELIRIIQILGEATQKIKMSSFEKSFIETLLLHITQIRKRADLKQLLDKILHLEKAIQKLSVKPTSPANTECALPLTQGLKNTPSDQEVKKISKPSTPISIQKDNIAEEIKKEPSSALPSSQEMSRFDTLMQFAAKELNGILKKT